MRVALRIEFDVPPDAVWDRLRDPAALGDTYAPLLRVEPVGGRRLPERWSSGSEALVRLRLLGGPAIGEQLIRIRLTRRGAARVLEDSGRPLSGPLAVLTSWRHRMAVVPAPGGRTVYLDRLEFSAGVATVLAWPVLWAMWQWRAIGLRRVLPALPRAAEPPPA